MTQSLPQPARSKDLWVVRAQRRHVRILHAQQGVIYPIKSFVGVVRAVVEFFAKSGHGCRQKRPLFRRAEKLGKGSAPGAGVGEGSKQVGILQ
jgi:hypothetical protein